VQLLLRIHHNDVMTLVGYGYENDNMILVYEYMSNGTLRDHLYGKIWPSSWVYSKRCSFSLSLGCVVKFLVKILVDIVHLEITHCIIDHA